MAVISDSTRLMRDEDSPMLLRLSRALARLKSTLTVMNVTARPGDELSGLLAWLRHGLGMRLVIACATRGESGENLCGVESGDALGLIRTTEMEAAAKVLDSHLLWLGYGMSDPVHDFGYSRDGEETLRRWRGDLVIRRLAGGYRIYRPDIVLLSHADIPGTPGHHRAMAPIAEAAMALAADPMADLGDVPGSDLPAWQVSKLYLPARPGGTGDGPVPTLTVEAARRDRVTGVPFERIGEWSRARHASQGLGRWPAAPRRSWDLHRLGAMREGDMAEGLASDLVGLADDCVDLPMLYDAAEHVAAALAQFPDAEAVVPHLLRADTALREADRQITRNCARFHGHCISQKRQEIALAISEAIGLRPYLSVSPHRLEAGGSADLRLQMEPGIATRISDIEFHLPAGATISEQRISTAPGAAPTPNFRPFWSPHGCRAVLRADVSFDLRSQRLTIPVPAIPDLCIAPSPLVSFTPAEVLLTPHARSAMVQVSPPGSGLTGSAGITLSQTGDEVTLSWPEGSPPGHQLLRGRAADGAPGFSETQLALPDGHGAGMAAPAMLRVLSLDCARPLGRIGVIAGRDRAGLWLQRLGADAREVEMGGRVDLSDLDAVLLGVDAAARRGLDPAALRDFVARGGYLLSLEHRAEAWNGAGIAPLPLRIGTAPARGCAVDPAGPVTLLSSDHSLLTGPNRITAEDWAGWVSHRGQNFAQEWDAAYEPLIELSDERGTAQRGAVLSARIGQGRHSHCVLSLPRQMDAGIPGAFRIFANLISAW
ncbi:N-acetylglucosaminyl deacetylase, LmbE family [Paracoccus isoporae]|uniref:N-acetylglucosaminyl deacetylase, LmbE family n=1 Tax=Paracoccus isoporae TaxID=591205 RepID=A0A1G7DCR2_9RHOB|nr:PIG-L family deacetylase [Paracoccus isoporae]SDE49259.1 N-acetylglucosaminyl deacetylase, LmbE family [Paracoccus isoporae]